jgi:hypothetical protein
MRVIEYRQVGDSRRSVMMIKQDQFSDLIGQIVTETFPDEATAFQIEGQRMVADLYAGGQIRTKDAEKAEFGFSLSSSEVIEFVKLLTATFTLVKTASEWLKPRSKKPIPEEIATRWKAELTRAGLSPSKSDQIVKKFSTELGKCIG